MNWQEYQEAVGQLYEQMNEFGIVIPLNSIRRNQHLRRDFQSRIEFSDHVEAQFSLPGKNFGFAAAAAQNGG